MKSQKMVEYAAPLCEQVAPDPVPQGTEVVVRISRCGVCHSDLHIYEGYFEMGGGNRLDVRGGRKLPFTLGHEIVGTVMAIGPEAEGVAVGDRRVVFPWIGCGACPTCERGEENLCNTPRALGITVAGGFASHVMVPHPRYLIDFGNVPAALAGTYMCSGLTAFSALKKLGNVGKNDPVVIVGLGGVGMMGLQFAKALFGTAPIAVDIDPGKLDAAARAGAGLVLRANDPDALKQLMAATGGAYAAIDFVGSEASLQFATSAVRKGGKVVIAGLFGGGFAMPIPMFPMRAISIAGTYVGTLGEANDMMALVKAGKVQPIPVATRPLSAASDTLNDLRSGKVLGRVVLQP